MRKAVSSSSSCSLKSFPMPKVEVQSRKVLVQGHVYDNFKTNYVKYRDDLSHFLLLLLLRKLKI